jgi:hypothetical protein
MIVQSQGEMEPLEFSLTRSPVGASVFMTVQSQGEIEPLEFSSRMSAGLSVFMTVQSHGEMEPDEFWLTGAVICVGAIAGVCYVRSLSTLGKS